MNDDILWVYVGTYTQGDSKGIYLGELDLELGRLHSFRLAGEATQPSFLALHPTRPLLYAVNETDHFRGQNSGGISAFSIQSGTGVLSLINQQPTHGATPCHLNLDALGSCVLVANYGGGSIASFPIHADGSLEEAVCFIQHEGCSIHPRQRTPHAHGIHNDATGQFIFVPDLGIDKILIYRFDSKSCCFVPHDSASARVASGSGPRHLAFHPYERFAYVVNELNSTVTSFTYNPDGGNLESFQTVPTLPEEFKSKNATAEIEVHPSVVTCIRKGAGARGKLGNHLAANKSPTGGAGTCGAKNGWENDLQPKGLFQAMPRSSRGCLFFYLV